MLSDCTGRAFSFNILGIIKNIENFGRFDFLPTLFFQVVSPCLRDFVFLPCLLEITYAHLALHLVNSSQSDLNFEYFDHVNIIATSFHLVLFFVIPI